MLYSNYEESFHFEAIKTDVAQNIVDELIKRELDGFYTFFYNDCNQKEYHQCNSAFQKNSFIPKVNIYAIKNNYTNFIKIVISPLKQMEIMALILMIVSFLIFLLSLFSAYFESDGPMSSLFTLVFFVCSYFIPYFFYTANAKKILKNFISISKHFQEDQSWDGDQSEDDSVIDS